MEFTISFHYKGREYQALVEKTASTKNLYVAKDIKPLLTNKIFNFFCTDDNKLIYAAEPMLPGLQSIIEVAIVKYCRDHKINLCE